MIGRRVARLARARWLALRAERTEGEPAAWGDLDHEGSEESRATAEPSRVDSDADSRARAVLGVGAEATADEIKSAYRALCRRYHPDRFALDPPRFEQANELLHEITRAYRTLSPSAGASNES